MTSFKVEKLKANRTWGIPGGWCATEVIEAYGHLYSVITRRQGSVLVSTTRGTDGTCQVITHPYVARLTKKSVSDAHAAGIVAVRLRLSDSAAAK